MRGFIAGTLVLIALETFTRTRNVDQITGGTNVLIAGLHRLLSAGVAGIPNTVKPATPAAATSPQGGTWMGYTPPATVQTSPLYA
jgi:hypothetical protein